VPRSTPDTFPEYAGILMSIRRSFRAKPQFSTSGLARYARQPYFGTDERHPYQNRVLVKESLIK
jgi:hypothetical protein